MALTRERLGDHRRDSMSFRTIRKQELSISTTIFFSCNFTLSSTLQLKKATVLAESSCFPFILKCIKALRLSPGLSQVDTTPFSPIYLFDYCITRAR